MSRVSAELTATEALVDRLRRHAKDRAGQLEVGTSGTVTITDDASGAAELDAEPSKPISTASRSATLGGRHTRCCDPNGGPIGG